MQGSISVGDAEIVCASALLKIIDAGQREAATA